MEGTEELTLALKRKTEILIPNKFDLVRSTEYICGRDARRNSGSNYNIVETIGWRVDAVPTLVS